MKKCAAATRQKCRTKTPVKKLQFFICVPVCERSTKIWRRLNKIFPRGFSAWRFAGGKPGASFQYHPRERRRAFMKGSNELQPFLLSIFTTNKKGLTGALWVQCGVQAGAKVWKGSCDQECVTWFHEWQCRFSWIWILDRMHKTNYNIL